MRRLEEVERRGGEEERRRGNEVMV